MKRKMYYRIHGKWKYKPEISDRTISMINNDIQFFKDILSARGTLTERGYKELSKLLLERTSRIGNKNNKG